jgi:isopenicillin N synthase-like dioxygenase
MTFDLLRDEVEKMTLLSISIIDIAPYWTGGDPGKRAVAALVDQACRDIGFLIISGHGIPEEMIEETRELARTFFDLPLTEKMRVGQPAPNVSRGYTPLASEAVALSRGAAAAAGPTRVEKRPPEGP